jgi:hypothetical protein
MSSVVLFVASSKTLLSSYPVVIPLNPLRIVLRMANFFLYKGFYCPVPKRDQRMVILPS